MREVEDEVREIKKEIVESRGLIIKTNNLVNALNADVKSISRRQAGYERRFKWDSGVALVVIGAVTFAGLKFYYDAQMSAYRSDMNSAETSAQELRTDLGDEVRRATERASAAAKAANYYELIRAKKRTEVVQQYPAISKAALSPAEAAMFRDVEQKFRRDLSLDAYKRGLVLSESRKYADAIKRFEEAVELDPDGSQIPTVRSALGFALRKGGRPAEALVIGQQVAKQETDAALQPDGWWLIALSAHDLGDLDTSRDALRVLINKFPRSALTQDARPMLREVTKEIFLGKNVNAATRAVPAATSAKK